jgi:Raf kinase inhibitor-like YbhB/YbcL family protein
MALTLTSPSFKPMGPIPVKHTCDGEDVSPALAWTNAPGGTQSFVLIVDDPDAPDPAAPKRTYVHWVLYDIPSTVSALAEGVKTADLREGMRDGSNDWKRTGYGGPCPPIGRHRYFFKLYALDRRLGNMGAATKADIQQVMANHVIEMVELVGTYERPKK